MDKGRGEFVGTVEKQNGYAGDTAVLYLVRYQDGTVDAAWSDGKMCGCWEVRAEDTRARYLREAQS